MKKESAIKTIIVVVISFIFFLLPSIISFFTFDFKIDYLCYKINDYNTNYYLSEGFHNPLIRTFNSDQSNYANKTYSTLHRHFYYTNFTDECRVIAKQKYMLTNFDGINLDVSVLTQNTFQVDQTITNQNGSFYIDFGQFYSKYYSIGEYKTPITPRKNAKSFVFISQSLSKKICSFYMIDEETLLSDERYNLLELNLPNGNLLVSINTVLDETTKGSSKMSKIHGEDFVLLYFNSNPLLQDVETVFELELKGSQYGTREAITFISSVIDEKCDVEFYTNNTNNSNFVTYSNREDLSSEFKMIYGKKDQIMKYVFVVLLFVCAFLLSIISSKLSKKLFYLLVCSLVFIFIILNIVMNFTYSFYLFHLPFMINFLFIIVFNYRRLLNDFGFAKKTSSKTESNNCKSVYFEI